MNVQWNKCKGDMWCELNRVNLQHEHFTGMCGVYVIWYGGKSPKYVRVGKGNINERLATHRKDLDIQAYASQTLFVTWASVTAMNHEGVEAYLADKLNPLVSERFPNAEPIPINLPGGLNKE